MAYQARINHFGLSYQALYYPNNALHSHKLRQASTVIKEYVLDHNSILDIGCGKGDLIPHIPACKYYGIDLIQKFVDEAKSKYPKYNFDCQNVFDVDTKFDWTVLVGVMGTVPNPEELVTKAWELATIGVIVDFIDCTKYDGYLNSYDLGICVNHFLDIGVNRITVLPSAHDTWAFYILKKKAYQTS